MAADQTFRIRGEEQGAERPATRRVAVAQARRILPGSRRGGGAGEITLVADEVLRLTLSNGCVLWTRADDLVRERGRQGVSRGGEATWELDTRPPERGRGTTRGWLGLGIAVLDCFGIDLKGQTAVGLGRLLEERQLQGQAPGLYRCDLGDTFALSPLTPDAPVPADQGPILLFIHGTGSSCQGSFGALWDLECRPARAARDELARRYGRRALAWEHRSLTQSPILNVLELVLELIRVLPEGADLHLVTHSRGGLIGELLCLAERERVTDPLRPDLLDTLFAADHTIAEQSGLGPLDGQARAGRDAAYQGDRQALAKLLTVLDENRIRIGRFVRTACPARGTTLASGRLDRWLSVFGWLGGWGVAEDVLDFVLAVVKERTDPRTLPGLEAMMPGSALTRLLQHPDLVTRSDLTVIAGDAQGESTWGQLKLLVADWFYGADHDLVVNTGSMVGGLRRPPGGARFLRDQGPGVNHVSYFKNERSLRWLTAGLTRLDGTDGGFQPLPVAPADPIRWRGAVQRSRAAAQPQPLAVVVPGMMGSALTVDGREVWLRYWTLVRGGLTRLRLGAGEMGSGVEVTAPLGAFYGPLLAFLARTHRVEVFPYDWRRSLRDAAGALAVRLDAWLPEAERAKQPVRLVAHSLGGLVVRAMIADGGPGAAVWRRIAALPESRLLMLGTPNQGSYEAVRWLTGRNPTLTKLSLLDVTQGPDDIIDIVRAFPGLLELLPSAPEDPDFSHPGFWQDLRQVLGARWTPADTTALRQARETWTLLRNSPVDPRRMVYVAGHQGATVADYRLDPAAGADPGAPQRLTFLATPQGDGTVTWRSGALPQVPVWYAADTGHDALCTHQAAFPGYLDLLAMGTTTRLSQVPPGGVRSGDGGGAFFPLPDRPPTDDIPDEAAVESLSFGEGLAAQEADRAAAPVIRLGIRHGDLAYARYPVLVGHYQGDTIVSAEEALDQRLGGALSERLQLGLYPGRSDTHGVFFNDRPRERPVGALVVGLGQVGDLAPGPLETGVRDALVDYALGIARWPDERFGGAGAVRSAAVSCLLVGSGAGGLSVADSVKAILRGALAAAERLVEAGLDHRVAIDRLEFIEIYQDRALAAAQALEETLRDSQLSARVVWSRRVIEDGEGAQRRVRCEESAAWWQRLEIVAEPQGVLRGADGGAALRFIAATDRARAEVTLAAGQLRLADAFIAQAVRSAAANAEAAKTLFEMLLPNRLRELAPRQRDLVVLVDEASARFPWELLEDRWSHHGRPPAVSAGMVRQLKIASYRPQPAYATAPKALIVGNPDLDGWDLYPDLPGARDEANRLAQLLRDQAYQVLDCVDTTADVILNGLHKDAWRILHLAGHGEHEVLVPGGAARGCPACGQVPPVTEERVSGMVIGRNSFLTPGDVEQLRWVPELVFISCCHLGKTQSSRSPRYNELAANLAVQFVRMGVKAVVAAGWAVDDRAGLAFAECFYDRLLAGAFFGEAVRAAREEVWQRFPDLNTWGAYQCYGDPAYRLRVVLSAGSPVTRLPYHAPDELIADLANLSQSLRMEARDVDHDPQSLTALGERIESLINAIPASEREAWLKRADVAAAVGLAWGETRAYGPAVNWLEQALSAEIGDCPLRALEGYNGLRVRLIGEEWRALRQSSEVNQREDRRQALVERLEQTITDLAQICQRSPTVERLTLIGLACRQLAWLQTHPRERLEALVNMAGYLERALAKAAAPDPRQFSLWASAKVLALGLDPSRGGSWQSSLPDDLRRMAELAAARNAAEPSFRNAVAEVDNETALLLTQLDPAPGVAQCIAERYRSVFRRGASPRQIAGVQEALDFVIDLGNGLPGSVRQALGEVRGAI